MSGLWRLGSPLLLASASPTRREMLERAGLPVEALPAPIDERALERGLPEAGPPVTVALALAEAKAQAVSRPHPGRLVLGADQTLACDGIRLHKPSGAAAARAQLAALSGRTHRLDSAFVLVRDGLVLAAASASALMTMRRLSPSFIEAYVAAEGATICATVGAYRVEGPGVQLFERIDGDHFTILGLPLLQVCAALRTAGALEA